LFLLSASRAMAAPEPVLIDSVNFDQDISSKVLNADSPIIYDTNVFHTSGRSIYYNRAKAGKYVLVRKYIDFKPGAAYSAKVWVKTKDIAAGGGALICIESYDKKGGYIDGTYLDPGVQGTSNWTQLSTPVYRIPANAAKVYVALYIKKGSYGTAWFDDLEVYQFRSELLKTTLISPAYRGLVWDGGWDSIKLKVQSNSTDYDIKNLNLKFELVDSANKVVSTQDMADNGDQIEITIPTTQLVPGQYRLRAFGIDGASGTTRETQEWTITKLSGKDQLPKSYVDKYGRFNVDGKPFFPLGFYFGGISYSELDEYANSPFNTILPYSRLDLVTMDMVQEKGLKVIYSVKDLFYGMKYTDRAINGPEDELPMITEIVNEYKDHPALLAWYFNDELTINDWKKQLKSHYEAIKASDPNHPAYEVVATMEAIVDHVNVTDTLGADPYPITGGTGDRISDPGSWTKTVKNGLPNRPIWMVVQDHNLANYYGGKSRGPNYQELCSMAWQDICEGATGLIFYSWFDIKSDVSGTPFKTL
jgi:hypothetical protein